MQGHPAPPPVISGSPDVTALIDKKTPWRIMAWFMNQFPYSRLLCTNITSVFCLLGRAKPVYCETAFLPNFEPRSSYELEVWQEVFASTLHLSGLV